MQQHQDLDSRTALDLHEFLHVSWETAAECERAIDRSDCALKYLGDTAVRGAPVNTDTVLPQ